MLDAAGQHVVGLHLKPFAMAVLRLDLHMPGALNGAIVSREGQAALVQVHLFLAQLQNFRVDELDELVFVIRRNLLRHVPVVQTNEQAAHHAHLRAGQPQTVGVNEGLLHIVQQGAQAVVKFGHGAADLLQNGIAVLDNGTQCHGNSSL